MIFIDWHFYYDDNINTSILDIIVMTVDSYVLLRILSFFLTLSLLGLLMLL